MHYNKYILESDKVKAVWKIVKGEAVKHIAVETTFSKDA